jgi:hypothetical protein
MGDTLSKACGLGIFVLIVDGVMISRHPREEQKVGVGHRLCRALKCFADLKIFKIFGRRWHVASCPLIVAFSLEGRRNRGRLCLLLTVPSPVA